MKQQYLLLAIAATLGTSLACADKTSTVEGAVDTDDTSDGDESDESQSDDDADSPAESDDSTGNEDAAAGPDAGTDTTNEEVTEPEDGVIATVTRVCGPEVCQSYINTYHSVKELQEAGEVDKGTGVEVGYSQGRTFNNSIYLFSREEDPRITRWSVKDDLSLVEEEAVSFANTGTKVFCEICNIFASKDLAYHLDATNGVMVAWNPEQDADRRSIGCSDVDQ